MNKMCRLLVLFLMIFSLGCSKGDDNTEDNTDVDPIYSLEYRPLKSFEELGEKQYDYVGIKVGNKNVGLLSRKSTSCSRYDKLVAQFSDNKFQRIVFYRMNKSCDGRDEVRLVKNSLVEEGIVHTLVYGSLEDLSKLAVDDEGRIALEIGFQGDYLRIEDRISHFTRTKHNEKVYLYFKRKDI